MAYNIITVSRQFGSGGRTIAHAVAEKLGIDYYDKELIKAVAEKTGFDPGYIEEAGEYSKSRSIFSYALPFTGHAAAAVNTMSTSDFLWIMQRKVILELAEKGPCVIVGRCADYILREREDALHVFIRADEDFRAERIVKLYGASEKTPEARMKDKDGRRAVNYKYYTGREWGKAENYDLSLNSGKLGIETCVSLITDLAKK